MDAFLQVQTLVEAGTDDLMQAIAVELSAAAVAEVVLDEIDRTTGFSTVESKQSASRQTGRQ